MIVWVVEEREGPEGRGNESRYTRRVGKKGGRVGGDGRGTARV